MNETTATRYSALLDGAAKAAGESRISYGLYTEGDFQIYAFPVGRRISLRRDHFRYTHYLRVDGRFVRTNKAAFLARLAEEAQ